MKLRRSRSFTLCIESHAFEPGLSVISGPNGAGKSTLLECLIGQRRRSVAHVAIDGLSLRDSSERNRAYARLGYVPQALVLPRSWRVADYLAYAGWLKRLDSAATERRSKELARVMEIDPDARISSLSGGFGRRLLIAQALMPEPSCLVLDEPLAGLDAKSQELLLRLISAVAQTGTVIATDHSGLLAAHADTVTRLKSGRIVC